MQNFEITLAVSLNHSFHLANHQDSGLIKKIMIL